MNACQRVRLLSHEIPSASRDLIATVCRNVGNCLHFEACLNITSEEKTTDQVLYETQRIPCADLPTQSVISIDGGKAEAASTVAVPGETSQARCSSLHHLREATTKSFMRTGKRPLKGVDRGTHLEQAES